MEPAPPQPVVLDTNFLLLPYQERIDVFRQVRERIFRPEIIVPSNVIDELEKLTANKGKTGSAARLALKILGHEKWTLVPAEGPVDRWIIDYARNHRAIVATHDYALRQRIKRLKLKCLVLKGRGWVDLA